MMTKVFGKHKPLIGVLQLLPLPGSIEWKGSIDQVIARAEQEATALATGGVDAILVENTFDAPYATTRMDTAGAIAMGLIIRRIMHFTHLPIGVNVLKNDPETALAIAMNVGARFIRVGLLTGAAICETGVLEGKHRDLAAYKRLLQIEDIAVLADVSLERTVPMVSGNPANPISLKYLAKQALEQGGADGLILTDSGLQPADITELSQSLDAPVYYDYGHPLHQVNAYLEAADGLLLSTVIKKSSVTAQDLRPTVDLTKVEEVLAQTEPLRTQTSSFA